MLSSRRSLPHPQKRPLEMQEKIRSLTVRFYWFCFDLGFFVVVVLFCFLRKTGGNDYPFEKYTLQRLAQCPGGPYCLAK